MCSDALASSGDGEIRTLDPLLARQVLSQLSYTPTRVAFDFACSPHGSHTRDQMLTGKFPSETWLTFAMLIIKYVPASTYSPVPSPAKYLRPHMA